MRSTLAHRAHRAAIHWLGRDVQGQVMSAGADGQLLGWHPERPGEVRVLATLPDAAYTAWHRPEEKRIILGTAKGELFILDLQQKKEAQRITAHNGSIFSLIGGANDLLYCASGDGTLTTWSMRSDGRLDAARRIPLGTAKLRALSIAEGQLAIACGDGELHVLDSTSLSTIAKWTAHEPGVSALAWHPSKAVLLSGGKDGALVAWDRGNNFRESIRIAAHRSTIYSIAFSPNGRMLATASRDKTVKLWDASTLDQVERLDLQHGGHSHSVNALLWMDDALISGGDDRALVIWKP